VKLALDNLLDSSLDRELIGAAIGARSGLMASNRWIIRPQAENFFILDNSDIETAIVASRFSKLSDSESSICRRTMSV
jgi:hypothetical protein